MKWSQLEEYIYQDGFKIDINMFIFFSFSVIMFKVSDGDKMEFLNKYNIDIKNQDLLLTALTHSSYSNEHGGKNYERLEFLGDAVLQLITSDYFYKKYNVDEGDLSKIRASFVCEEALAQYSKDLGIDKHIRVGNGQLKNINDTIIADCFESVLGAIYLECGLNVASNYVLDVIAPYVLDNHVFLGDYKSRLQEMVQTDRKSLEYRLVLESGPSHDKTFVFEVVIDGIVYGKGTGKNKKEAEQNAAKDAINKKA